ncbi:MAG: EscU/YscU/HrcU family type III secretion system export apparatus switch protein [Chitinispirillaceae bacterium]|nr:EscU/YscU/HrcU family type III secretion system export apparatus switch protein [Chitinispirillaceae bacterium]
MEEEKRDKAVALRYNKKVDKAPKVVAKGEGFIAQKIKEIAISYGIPIKRDDALVELLAQVELDREIPPELYAVVAELLSWIYRANRELSKEIK